MKLKNLLITPMFMTETYYYYYYFYTALYKKSIELVPTTVFLMIEMFGSLDKQRHMTFVFDTHCCLTLWISRGT